MTGKERRPANQRISEMAQARLVTFIKKYVSPRQEEMAELLGVSQSTVSNIIRGQTNPTAKVWDMLITKYNLNTDWVFEGTGSPVMKKEGKPTKLVTDIGELQTRIDKLENTIKILTANNNQLYKMVEALEKRIESFGTSKQQ